MTYLRLLLLLFCLTTTTDAQGVPCVVCLPVPNGPCLIMQSNGNSPCPTLTGGTQPVSSQTGTNPQTSGIGPPPAAGGIPQTASGLQPSVQNGNQGSPNVVPGQIPSTGQQPSPPVAPMQPPQNVGQSASTPSGQSQNQQAVGAAQITSGSGVQSGYYGTQGTGQSSGQMAPGSGVQAGYYGTQGTGPGSPAAAQSPSQQTSGVYGGAAPYLVPGDGYSGAAMRRR